jgi:hypothetical protein
VANNRLNRYQEAIAIAQQGIELARQGNNSIAEISFLISIACNRP